MPEPVLSAEEIDALLTPRSLPSGPQPILSPPPARGPFCAGAPAWIALEALLAHGGESFVQGIAQIVRAPLEFESLPLEESTGRAPCATGRWSCRATLAGERAQPGGLLVSFDGPLLGWLMGRMLGGREAIQLESGRGLTPIEERMVLRIAGIFYEALAGTNACLSGLTLDRVAAESAFASELARGVRWSFAVRGPALRGHIEFQWPGEGARRLAEGLLAKQPLDEAPEDVACEGAASCGTLVTASLQTIEVPFPAGSCLEVGDVIDTELPASEPLVIAVDGVPRFQGSPSQWEGRLVVEIESTAKKQSGDSTRE